jgi:hypothetical protein
MRGDARDVAGIIGGQVMVRHAYSGSRCTDAGRARIESDELCFGIGSIIAIPN